MAGHWHGGAPIPWLETLGPRRLMRLYAVYERQTTEEEIRNEYLFPGEGKKPRKLPAPKQMRALVDRRIAEMRQRERDEAEREGAE